MSWSAVLPLKPRGQRKARLAALLDAAARDRLSELLFRHVADVLLQHPRLAAVELLSDERPPGWRGAWRRDGKRGLNGEIEAALAHCPDGALVIHADLPLLAAADIDALIDAAEAHGVALAPDRHGIGTNAVALMLGRRLTPRFGPDSLNLHMVQTPAAALVRREGLALDIDTPLDLEAACAAGFVFDH